MLARLASLTAGRPRLATALTLLGDRLWPDHRRRARRSEVAHDLG